VLPPAPKKLARPEPEPEEDPPFGKGVNDDDDMSGDDDDDLDPDDFDPDDFDDDDDDEPKGGLSHREQLIELAERMLPRREAILKVLDNVTELDFVGIVVSRIMEDSFRNRVTDAHADSLTIAALAASAKDIEFLLEVMPRRSLETIDEFMSVLQSSRSLPPKMIDYAGASMDTQRLIVAHVVADLELIHKGIMFSDENATLPMSQIRDIARFFAEASECPNDKPTKGDVDLMMRAMNVFNDLSHDIDLDIDLVLKAPHMTISVRNKTAAPDPNTVRPKFNSQARPSTSKAPKAKKPDPGKSHPGPDGDDGGYDDPPHKPWPKDPNTPKNPKGPKGPKGPKH